MSFDKTTLQQYIASRYRGLLIVAVGSMAAFWLAEHYATPVMLLALLLGLAMNFLYSDDRITPGVDLTSGHLLKTGVALLGLRIEFSEMADHGVIMPLVVMGAMICTFIVGHLLAKSAKLSGAFARLSAGSVAVCGVSAAIAIAAVLPNRKNATNELAMVVISVTALSTLSMIFYPMISNALNFSDEMAGVFIGGSIHDVAQVVGAGYSVSDEAGDAATVIKLFRVALLLPIVLLIGISSKSNVSSAEKPPILPAFLIGFLALAALNSFGFVPEIARTVGVTLSRALLISAIFAIGIKSQLGNVLKVGIVPFLILCAETLVMAGVVIAGIMIF